MKTVDQTFKVTDDQGYIVVRAERTMAWDDSAKGNEERPAWELVPCFAGEFDHKDRLKNHRTGSPRMIVRGDIEAKAEAERLAIMVIAFNEQMKDILERHDTYRKNWTPLMNSGPLEGALIGDTSQTSHTSTFGFSGVTTTVTHPFTDEQLATIRLMIAENNQATKRRKRG